MTDIIMPNIVELRVKENGQSHKRQIENNDVIFFEGYLWCGCRVFNCR